MVKYIDVEYWKPSYFNNISWIFGTGYGLGFNYLFRFIKSLRKRTWFVLGLSCAKDGDTHTESFALLRTHIRTKCSTSFLTFLRLPSLPDMVFNISASHTFLIISPLYLFSRCQVFHQTTIRIFVITLSIHYIYLCQMLALIFHNLISIWLFVFVI